METTQRAAAPSLLGQVRTAAGLTLLGIGAAVLFWAGMVAVWRATSAAPMAAKVPQPLVIDGGGDMSTDPFRLWAGVHRLTWTAPCLLDVDLWRITHDGPVFMYQVGAGRERDARIPVVFSGDYILSVGAACDWQATVL